MKKNIKAYARALYEATRGSAGKELAVIIERFVAILGRQRMLKSAPLIIAEFTRYAKEQEGIVEIEVTSARELAAATLNQIKKVFSAQGGSAWGGGKTVEAREKVNPELLGGVIIRTKDTVLDGSLRAQLDNLKICLSTPLSNN